MVFKAVDKYSCSLCLNEELLLPSYLDVNVDVNYHII